MNGVLSLFNIVLFIASVPAVFPVYAPEPVEATTVKSSKSNSQDRQVEPVPAPEPVEATTVKSSKSNSSE